jgi:hypothetical protein
MITNLRRFVALAATLLMFLGLLSACNRQPAKAAETILEKLATVSSNPANGTTVSPTTPIVLTFDTAMNPQSVQDASALYVGNYSAVTNPTTWTNLQLTAMCDGRWRVRNSNAFPLAFTWDVYGKTEKGLGVAAPSGDTFFYTSKGSKTVRLFVNNKQQGVKASNSTVCTDAPFTFVWNADNTSVTITPNTPLLPLTTYTFVLSQGAMSSTNALAFTQAFQTTFTTTQVVARKLAVDGTAPCNLRVNGGSFSNYLLMQDVNNNVLTDTLQLGDISFADVKVFNTTEQELSTATLIPSRIITRPNENNAASVVILLDESGSIDSFDRQKLRISAAKELVAKLRPGDEAAIAVFQTPNVRVFQTFTTDKTLLNNALDVVTGSSSSAYTSLLSTIKLFEGRTNPGKAIVMLTDGQAGSDNMNFADVVTKANAQNIRLFPIGFNNSVRSLQFLSWLACETNGAYDKIERPEALETLFKALTNQLLTDGTNLESAISFATALPGKNNYILKGTTNVRVAGQTVTSPFSIPFSIQDPVPSAPTLESLTPNTGPSTGGVAITIRGTGFLDAAVVSFGTSTVNASVSTANSAQISPSLPAIAATASGQVEVKVKTPFGTSNALPFTYYPEYRPEVVTLTAAPSSPQVGEEVTVSWQVRDQGGEPLSCTLKMNDGAQYTIADCTATTSQTHTFTSIPSSVTTTLTVSDTKFSVNRNLTLRVVAAEPTPKLTTLSLTTGPLAGGTPLVLTGENLSNVTAVSFGGTAATAFTVHSPTQITATIPARSAGAANVTVSSPRGGTSNALAYTYVALPVITSFSPAEAVPGATITLNGSRLDRVTVLNFGNTTLPFTIVSSSRLTFVAPNTTPGSVNITVVSPGGTSAARAFTLLAPPVPAITTISPTEGTTVGGDTVTITGTNFTGVNGVTFGAKPATSFTVVSDTQITVVTPASAKGIVEVKVSNPFASSNTTPFAFVSSNQGPRVDNFTVSNSSAGVAEPIQFSWTVSDPNGDILSCLLNFGDGSRILTISDCANVNSQSYQYVLDRNYVATLTVLDPETEQASATVNIAVSGTMTQVAFSDPLVQAAWQRALAVINAKPYRLTFDTSRAAGSTYRDFVRFIVPETDQKSFVLGTADANQVVEILRYKFDAINDTLYISDILKGRAVTIDSYSRYAAQSLPESLRAELAEKLKPLYTDVSLPALTASFNDTFKNSFTDNTLMFVQQGGCDDCSDELEDYRSNMFWYGVAVVTNTVTMIQTFNICAIGGGAGCAGAAFGLLVSTAATGYAAIGVWEAQKDYYECLRVFNAGYAEGTATIAIMTPPLPLSNLVFVKSTYIDVNIGSGNLSNVGNPSNAEIAAILASAIPNAEFFFEDATGYQIKPNTTSINVGLRTIEVQYRNFNPTPPSCGPRS